MSRNENVLKEDVVLEVCVDSVASAVAAERGGADRIELCSDILEGGITPSLGLLELVRTNISIGIHVLVRPRRGGFHYSSAEYDVMLRDIGHVKASGANGVVLGILKKDLTFDIERIRDLIGAAHPMRVTVHRAFDVCKNPFTALGELADIGANAILTSGRARSAVEGAQLLAELKASATPNIELIAAGKITPRNVDVLRRKSGLTSYHVGSGISSRKRETRPDGFFSSGELEVVDSTKISAVLKALRCG